MLSGNMSSTASAIVNMTTNSTMDSSFLQMANPDDSSLASQGTKAVLMMILLMGIGAYLWRNTSLRAVLRNQVESHRYTEIKSAKDEYEPLLTKSSESNMEKGQKLDQSISALFQSTHGQSQEATTGVSKVVEMVDLTDFVLSSDDEDENADALSSYQTPKRGK